MSTRSFRFRPARRLIVLLALMAVAQSVSAQTSPSAYTWATRYDLMGRVAGTIAPDPDGAGPLRFLAVRNTYDAAGRLIKVENGELASWQSEAIAPSSWSGFTIHQTVGTTYDAQSRKKLETVKGSDGVTAAATQYSYDSVGRLECTAVRMNPAAYGNLPSSACTPGAMGSFGPDRIARNVYNNVGQLWKIQKAVGTSLAQDYATYTYSPNGNRESITDARGYRAEMRFDGFDRQSRWYFPSSSSPGVASTSDYEAYGYDGNGNRTSLRKRDGSVLTYTYDALNRMTVKVVPERAGLASSHTRDVYYGYDSFGRMTYARFDSPSGQGISIGYSGFNEVTSLITSLPGVSTSMTFLFDKDGNRTRVTYDDNNYITYGYDGMDRSSSVLRNGSATLASYTYNASGRRANMGGAISTSYDYHPDGRLWKLTNTLADPAYVVQYGFSYNPSSQITQLTRSNDAYAWTGATNLNQSYAANGLNQYTSVAGKTFSHDANGNLTYDGFTTYLYDVENRLVSASGANNAQLRYDPLGRLYEISGGASGTTRFAYDGDALVQEFDGSGSLLRRYVHGTEAGDDPIVWFEGSGFADTQQRLLRTDHLGSVVSIADGTGENVLAINTYDPYGVPGAANQGKFQYTGQAWVPELGLYYYKARMYSPELGRFMQTDPIGYEDGLNLYAYVGNDSINASDPTGTVCVFDVTSDFCVRSRLYEYIDSDERIASRTSFFAAAAIVTNAFGTPGEKSSFMSRLSEKLENENLKRAGQIRAGKLYTAGTIESNTNDFIHFEQSVVQSELEALQSANPEAYAQVIQEANANINGYLLRLGGRAADPNFARAVRSTQQKLGRDIDFANQDDREALGRAVARESKKHSHYCTGSIIRRC